MITKKVLALLITDVYLKAQNFLFLIILSNIWGLNKVGIFSFALSFVNLFAFLMDFQFSTSHIFHISREQNNGKNIGTYIFIKSILAFVMIFTVLVSIYINFSSLNHVELILIIMFLIYNLQLMFVQITFYTFQAKLNIFKSVLPAILGTTLGFILRIIIILAYNDLALLGFTYVLSGTFQLIVSIKLLRSLSIELPNILSLKKYFKFTYPFMLSFSIVTFAASYDKYLIGINYSSEILGKYYILQTNVLILGFISSSVGMLLLPIFSELHAKNKYDEIKSYINKSERLISLYSLPVIMIGYEFGIKIFDLFYNTNFSSLQYIFVVFLIQQFFSATNRPYVYSIVGSHKTLIAASLDILTNFSLILLLFLFINKGFEIIALIFLTVTIGGTISWRTVVRRYYGISINKSVIIQILVVIFLSYVFSYLSNLFSLYSRINSLLSLLLLTFVSSIILILCYFLILILLKEYKRNDFDLIVKTLR